jgi:hypothetical protein
MRRALVLALLVTGCDVVLGGLPEGHPRPPPAPPLADAGPCADWLDGYAYRQPFVVTSTAAGRAVQIPFAFDTGAAVARGALRPDLADVRVTTEDGRTIAPHWRVSPTAFWTKLDVEVGDNPFWVYYGRADATDASSLADTFVSGVVDAPGFERAWRRAASGFTDTSTSTNYLANDVRDGVLTVSAFRPESLNGASGGVCETMLFPAGSTYQFEVDAEVLLADGGGGLATLDFIDGPAFWGTRVLGQHVAARGDIDPGWRTLCLGVTLAGGTVGQGAKVTYARPRVRRVLPGDPSATIAGAEERRCE